MTTDFPRRRPDHPDFWLMAEIVQDLDAASEDGLVDMESLMYMAEQRGLRILMYMAEQQGLEVLDHPATWNNLAILTSVWVDAFKAGMEFQRRAETHD